MDIFSFRFRKKSRRQYGQFLHMLHSASSSVRVMSLPQLTCQRGHIIINYGPVYSDSLVLTRFLPFSYSRLFLR